MFRHLRPPFFPGGKPSDFFLRTLLHAPRRFSHVLHMPRSFHTHMGSSTKFESLIGHSNGVMRLRTQSFCWGSVSKFTEPDFMTVCLRHLWSCHYLFFSALSVAATPLRTLNMGKTIPVAQLTTWHTIRQLGRSRLWYFSWPYFLKRNTFVVNCEHAHWKSHLI